MKQVILGTAGHIDHGKTTLVKALTGIDTDRLKEEKERGITIELGFAYLELPGGQLVGIVDVPGHEKFVRNMVAGATGIDMVALIIAADEGVMPQTREHMEICSLLDIKHGLVVLTKKDMVEADWLELVREDVTDFLEGTFLEGAPVVEVSAVTGEGLEELKDVIGKIAKAVPERRSGAFFRIPIDRVFTMKGFGTVITGTTISGSIKVGDEVTIYPRGIVSRVRGIQIHNREVNQVKAGLRTAINLQGVERREIQRGDIVAEKGSLRPTYLVDVSLELLPSAPRGLKNRGKVRFHSGTSEIMASVVLLDREELKPGEGCFAQVRLEEQTALLRKDRYVLRSYSPVQTIGGGEILNPLPKKKKRFSQVLLSELEVLSRGTSEEIAELFVRMGRFEGINRRDLHFLTNVNKSGFGEVVENLLQRGNLVEYDKEKNIYIHSEYLARAKQGIIETLAAYHRDFPLKVGLQKEELRSRTVGSRNQKLFNHVISSLIREKAVVQERETLRLASHQVTLGENQERTRKAIEEAYLKGGLQPPYFKELEGKLPGDRAADVLNVMLGEGVLVKVKEDLYFHRDVIEGLKKNLIDFLKEKGEITTPQFKEMTGASRKYTIPLIEYFDRTQVTVRVGDNRVLRKK
ncbi:MAG: selenocysteine-specific translation elongation factor [Deltaproteobacteria bacterium]|nr:selenocysteine-specific translation elongation factor [Deltaproteobacteria bacterium]